MGGVFSFFKSEEESDDEVVVTTAPTVITGCMKKEKGFLVDGERVIYKAKNYNPNAQESEKDQSLWVTDPDGGLIDSCEWEPLDGVSEGGQMTADFRRRVEGFSFKDAFKFRGKA